MIHVLDSLFKNNALQKTFTPEQYEENNYGDYEKIYF